MIERLILKVVNKHTLFGRLKRLESQLNEPIKNDLLKVKEINYLHLYIQPKYHSFHIYIFSYRQIEETKLYKTRFSC